MRLFGWLRKRETPVDQTPVGGVGSGEGYDQSAYSPAEYGDYVATSNDVYAAANVRAKALAKLPVQVFDGSDKLIDNPNHPLVALLASPNPHWSWPRMAKAIELARCLWGQFYAVIESTTRGLPGELWWIKPTQMRPIPHPTEYLSGYEYLPPDGSSPRPFDTQDVIWAPDPNIIEQYAPLSPLAAARLAADTASASLKANYNLFAQGMLVGGFITPTDEIAFTPEQAKDAEKLLDRRTRGVDKAHRWSVMPYKLNIQEMSVTPKDAQFIEGMNLYFRQVCRAFGVPPPLVGDAEYATLANLRVYERALWEHTMEDEAAYIGAELTRQLAPRFNNVGHIGFDLSDVVALQEDEEIKWGREREQLELGAITINEWRQDQGLDTVDWGDAPWLPATQLQVGEPRPQPTTESVSEPETRAAPRFPESDPEQIKLAADFEDTLAGIFDRIGDAAQQQLKQGRSEPPEVSLDGAPLDDETLFAGWLVRAGESLSPFDLDKWRERTRRAVRARHKAVTEWTLLKEAGKLEGLSPSAVYDLLETKAVRAAIEGNVQNLARRVTQTTWERMQLEIGRGVSKGETLEQIAERLTRVTARRIEDTRRIAQTEMTIGRTTGQNEAFRAAGVFFKTWRTMRDGAVRDTHLPMEGVTVGVGERFFVGGGSGPGPGQIGVASEDVNCRCFLEPAKQPRGNGQGTVRDLQGLVEALTERVEA